MLALLVALPVAGVTEGLAAVAAAVWLQPQVGHHVATDVLPVARGLLAQGAEEHGYSLLYVFHYLKK